ncbi:MAG: integration host factor [Rhizobium sp.]|nr:integration host factor [Rhizobium sp.]
MPPKPSVLPKLTKEERQAALEKAAVARKKRAALKNKAKEGGYTFSEILEMAEEDETVKRTRVMEILRSMPKIGQIKAQQIMDDLEIAHSRKLGGLGKRQKDELLKFFGEKK